MALTTVAAAEQRTRWLAEALSTAMAAVRINAAVALESINGLALSVADADVLRSEVEAAEARKVAALEAEAVAADCALEALQAALADTGDGQQGTGAASDALACALALGDSPRELADLSVIPADAAAAGAGVGYRVCSPRGFSAGDVEARGAPGRCLAFTAAYVASCGGPAEVALAVAALAARAAVDVSLRAPMPAAAPGPAMPPPLPLTLVPRPDRACIEVSSRLPAATPAGTALVLSAAGLRGAAVPGLAPPPPFPPVIVSAAPAYPGGPRPPLPLLLALANPPVRAGPLTEALLARCRLPLLPGGARGTRAAAAAAPPPSLRSLLDGAWAAGGGLSTEESGPDGRTPLAEAARQGLLDDVDALLGAGAAAEARDKWGAVPLMHAAAAGHAGVVAALLAAGADASARDNAGWTALFHAAYESRAGEVLALLLAATPGGSVRATDRAGRCALFHALRPRQPRSADAVAAAAQLRALGAREWPEGGEV